MATEPTPADGEAGTDDERRTETVSIKVTPSEKEALDTVGRVYRKSHGGLSGLLRARCFGDVLDEGQRIVEATTERRKS